MIWLVFIALAAICKAVVDVTRNKFYESIFTAFDPFWWDGEESWRNKYIYRMPEFGRVKWRLLGFEFNKPVQITDAFHFFNTLMIGFFFLACITYKQTHGFFFDAVAFYISFNGSFMLFYSRILIL